MSKFALVEMSQVRGKIKYFKLSIDNSCPFDEFCKAIRAEGNLAKQLVGIFSNFDQIANLKTLPKEKFRDITPGKELVKEYEFKKGDLRVYAFKDPAGHVVVVGGKKSTQDEDITWFRSIKKRYFDLKN